MTTETTNLNGKKKKVLIVDDEPDISIILKKVFEQNGFNADSYDDPILALENFKPGSYDILGSGEALDPGTCPAPVDGTVIKFEIVNNDMSKTAVVNRVSLPMVYYSPYLVE